MPRGAAQVLAPGRREEVAPERVDVDRELAGGLARVEQVGHARVAGDRAHRRGRVHQPALTSGSTTSRPGARGRRASRAARRPTAGRPRRRAPPRRAHRCGAASCSRRDHVARVLRVRREDAVAGLERRAERVERPCPTRASRSRPARSRRPTRRRARRPSRRPRSIARRPRRRPRSRRRAPRARGARSRCRRTTRGRERRARVVEVDDVAAPGRVGADARDVDHRDRRLSWLRRQVLAARHSSQSSVK